MSLILSLSKINLVGQPSPTGATLNIPFANQKNIIDIISGSSLITFTRASTATFVGSNGLIQTAAVNAPRFDHNPTTGESLGLLVEESRTNLVLRSEEFDNASWTKVNLTITPNTTTAPNGTITADSVIPNTITSIFYTQQDVTTTASTIYTWSVYLKANGFSWVFLDAFDGSNHRTWFDIANGVVGTVEAGNTSTITSVGNGWYRCTLTRLSAGGLVSYAVALVSGNNALTGTGNSTNGVYAWGAQTEAGAFPTSYIPTTTAAVTRSACVAKVNTLSPWFNASLGTLLCEGSRYAAGLTTGVIAGFSQNLNFAQSIYISNDVTLGNTLTLNVFNSTLQAAIGGTVSPGVTSNFKVAVAYQDNNFASSINGAIAGSSLSGSVPSTIDNLTIGSSPWTNAGDNSWSGWIRRIVYYPRRLSNTELQLITS
jgi:hypothetical protein